MLEIWKARISKGEELTQDNASSEPINWKKSRPECILRKEISQPPPHKSLLVASACIPQHTTGHHPDGQFTHKLIWSDIYGKLTMTLNLFINNFEKVWWFYTLWGSTFNWSRVPAGPHPGLRSGGQGVHFAHVNSSYKRVCQKALAYWHRYSYAQVYL